jgi:hypothetical protein
MKAGALRRYPRAQLAFDLSGRLAAPQFLRRDGRTIEQIEASLSLARSRSWSVKVAGPDGTTMVWSDLRGG